MTSGHCHRQIYASGDPSESPVQSFTVSSRRAVDNFTSAWLFKAAWLCFAAVVFRQVRAPTSPRYSMHFQPCHVQGIRFSTSSAVRRKSHGNHASPASRGVTNHTTLGQTNGPVANGSQFSWCVTIRVVALISYSQVHFMEVGQLSFGAIFLWCIANCAVI